MATGNLKTNAVKGAGINVIAQFIGTICQTVGVIVLARLLKPTDFGLVAMVTAFSMWVMNFGENGFAEFIIQKEHISKEDVNSIFWLHVFIASLLALAFIFFGIFLVDFYSEPALWGIAAAMSTSIILTAFTTSPLALLQREMKFTSIAILQLVAIVLSIVFAIAAAAGGMTYWSVVIRQLTVSMVTAIGAWIFCSWRPGIPVHLSRAFPGLKYAVQVYCNYSLGYLTKNIDKMLLGKFYGSEFLGNYDRAYYLSSMPANQLLFPLSKVALATLSRLVNDKERFIAFYIKAITILSLLGTFSALILTLTAEDLILMLLGPKWKDAGRVVMAFGPGIAATLLYGTRTWLHLSLGTPNRWLRWNIFASIVTIAAFLIAAPYGPVSMAIAYSTTGYVLVVPALWYGARPIDLSIKAIFVPLSAYFASATTVLISWVLLSSYWSPLISLLEKLSTLVRILMVSCVALFFYFAFVILFQWSFRSIREILTITRLFFTARRV